MTAKKSPPARAKPAAGQLGRLRKEIDALDDQLLDLLEARARLAQVVGEEKRAQQLATYSVPEREAEILRRLKKNSTLLKPHIEAIYREIISACLACEKPASVAYLGPAGTYSHDAALKMFGHAAQLSPETTIEAVISEAEKQHCDFAIVPFENSAAGTIGSALDALFHTPLTIVGETILRIRHNLLAAGQPALNAVREVYAHPQALEQCRGWLENHLPRARQHPADSNAAAAEIAAKSGKVTAAICSLAAGELYRLTPLAKDIEDVSNNSTRFLVLGRQQPAATGADKTSFIMTVKDEPGAMFKVLKPLSDSGINMVKLESRPVRGRLWEYMFFIDCIGHQQEAVMAAVLRKVKRRAAFMKILGSYPQAVS